MTGLIEEIQVQALDSAAPVDALLRRVKLAAAKLQLGDLESWVEQELNGYEGEVPAYRKAHGQVAGWNPYRGWIPVHGDARWLEVIGEVRLNSAIATIRDLLEHNNGETLHYPLPPRQLELVNQSLNHSVPRIVVQISRGHLVAIVDAVRNLALNWAIAMERKGILGEGMSFTKEEKDQAKAAMTNINIGSIGSMIGNLGYGNVAGDISATNLSVADVASAVDQIEAAKDGLIGAGADAEKITSAIGDLKREIAQPRPDHSKLHGLLGDLRAALSGAAGSLIASGAISLINSLLPH